MSFFDRIKGCFMIVGDYFRKHHNNFSRFSELLLRNSRSIKPRVAKENGSRELVVDMHRAQGIILARYKAVLPASSLIIIHEALTTIFYDDFHCFKVDLLTFPIISCSSQFILAYCCLFSLSLGLIVRKQTPKLL